MQSSLFIFSPDYRLKRHLLFWLCWWLFSSFLYAFTPASLGIDPDKRLLISSADAVIYLVPHIFFSYSLMYFVVPELLLKSKYTLSALSILVLVFITAVISAVIGMYIIEDFHRLVFPERLKKEPQRPLESRFFLAILAGLRGAITIGGMAAAIKLMKHWYVNEQRNMQLQNENIQSQLQLLKAQVHPHFLFNTLNNIYSYTQNTSLVASQLVLGLSEMLRYMLYEGTQPLVALAKEVKMLQDYITLERIRYGNKLEVNIDVPDNMDEFEIAPLLLLPFVENSFKHSVSQKLDQPWLSLHLAIHNSNMHMKLVNGKPENHKTLPKGTGIGIQNIQRRLEILYPGKHSLKIQNEREVFIVDLKLELVRKSKDSLAVSVEKTFVYEQ